MSLDSHSVIATPVDDGASESADRSRASASLPHRAGRLWLGGMIQQVIKVATGLVLSPLIVHSLGVDLYGAWVMIQQSTGYLALGDLRTASSLRLLIGTTQHVNDVELRRRQVGSALIVWLRMMPLVGGVGALLVWGTPALIRVTGSHAAVVQWAMAVSVLAVVVDQILAIPGNVLRGLNLDYKAVGLRTVALAAGAVLTIAVVALGGGLIGVAVAGVAAVAISGGAYLAIALRELPWLGFSRPRPVELSQFTGMTIWLFLSTLGTLMLNASDFLLVGYLLGPAAAAVYAATGAVLRLAADPVHSIGAAANPGLVGLCGSQAWSRVERLRIELHLVALFITTVLGVSAVCFNQGFIGWWLGPALYGGQTVNFLLVLLAFQLVPLRTDLAIVDGMAAYRQRALVMCGGGLLSLLIGGACIYVGGLPGMAIGTFVGRFILIAGVARIIRRQSGITTGPYLSVLGRPLLVALLLIAVALALPWHAQGLGALMVGVLFVAPLTAAVMWQVGLGSQGRAILLARLKAFNGMRPRAAF